MAKGHFEISFKEGVGYNDYVSKDLKECIASLVKSFYFESFTVTDIKWVEDKE